MHKQGDVSTLLDFYSYDRPLSVWTYLVTLPVLGANPQTWQIFTLLLRALTAFAMWGILAEIWPKRRFTAAAAALLFLVYPTFTQQSISVAYSQHFITYSFFFFSVWAMLRAQKSKHNYWPWTLIALGTAGLHLATLEYFGGLELTRPLILFLFFSENQKGLNRETWRRVIKRWAPYFVILAAFAVWRFLLLSLPADPNHPQLLSNFSADPIGATLLFVERSLQDFIFIVFGPWDNIFYSELIDFSNLSRVVSMAIAALVAAATTVYLRYQASRSKRDSESQSGVWGGQLIAFGALAIFLGMLPVRIADRDVLSGVFADRFTLPAMFGAAILWVGLARVALRDHYHRAILIAILIGLSTGAHFRIANNYSWDWEKQSRIYWQLTWRAPGLAPNTALVGTGALSGFVTEYAAAAAINTLYQSPINDGKVNYWVFDYFDDLQPHEAEVFSGAETLSSGIRNLTFEGSGDSLLFFDYSTTGQCLWILDAEDEFNPGVDEAMRTASQFSALRQIQEVSATTPYSEVFGQEPEHTWCYFYEKIDLATQFNDWDEAVALWRDAQSRSYIPNNQVEILPVVDALVHAGFIDEGVDLTLDAFRKQPDVRLMFCAGWKNWLDGTVAHTQGVDEMLIKLECGT